jgi:hypothetical protein
MVDLPNLGQSRQTRGHPIAVVGVNKIGPKISIGDKLFRRIAEKTRDIRADIRGSVETARASAISNGGPVFQHSRLVMPRVVVQTDQHALRCSDSTLTQTRSSISPKRRVPSDIATLVSSISNGESNPTRRRTSYYDSVRIRGSMQARQNFIDGAEINLLPISLGPAKRRWWRLTRRRQQPMGEETIEFLRPARRARGCRERKLARWRWPGWR